jgi:hypothetical protein
MIDPILSLAFNLHSNKGAYALLLGSGISSAAEIPTGFDVVIDLVRKLAKVCNEDCELDHIGWFEKKYSDKPSYSNF